MLSVSGPLLAIYARIACCNSSTVMSSGDLFISTITVFSFSAVASVFFGKLFSADMADVSAVFSGGISSASAFAATVSSVAVIVFCAGDSVCVEVVSSVSSCTFSISAVSVFTGIYYGI